MHEEFKIEQTLWKDSKLINYIVDAFKTLYADRTVLLDALHEEEETPR